MNRIDLEREYWNEAALDPDVDRKYISDVSTEECLAALDAPKLGKILDVGCGVGRIANALSEGGHSKRKIFGIDISEEMLDLADDRRRCWPYSIKYNGNEYKLCDGRTIPYKDSSINFAYSMLLFQHLKADTIQSYMKETYRVLEPKGIFRFQFIEGDEQEPFSNHYSLDQMKTWLEDARLEFIKADKGLCHPMWTWVTARKP